MKYLKLFNDHSGYTEYIEGDVIKPNVSHCIQEDEVHYTNRLPAVLPGNEEAWELYSSLICDDERLARDLTNIFSKYEVSYSLTSNTEYYQGHMSDPLYTDNGYTFTFTTIPGDPNYPVVSSGNYKCIIYTSRNARGSEYILASVTNDCGQDILPNGVGQWNEVMESIGPIGPTIS